MIKRESKRLFSALLAFCLLLGLFPVSALAVTQADIDALRAQRDEITAQKEEKQAALDQLEEEQAGVLERKLAMDERNMYTIQEIQSLNEEIALYDQMIADKAAEVAQAQRREEEQLERYRTRVRAMEEGGELSLLAMVFNTSSLSEMLTAIDDIAEIMKSDRELEDDYIAAREETEKAKAEYEAVRQDLESRQQLLRDQQVQLELEIEEAVELIRQLEEEIGSNQALLDELIASENEANARIQQMTEELRAVSGTGSFLWPAPSTNYCTSRFGLRIHPVYGTERYHTGLDIGAGAGATVLASDGGTVTMASVNGGYGNCVMIDHGNGYATLYGHLSAFAVSAGQTVSQGDVIGYVGDTGVTTGPHLHFEILLNGGRIDPEQFFSGLTFSPDAGV